MTIPEKPERVECYTRCKNLSKKISDLPKLSSQKTSDIAKKISTCVYGCMCCTCCKKNSEIPIIKINGTPTNNDLSPAHLQAKVVKVYEEDKNSIIEKKPFNPKKSQSLDIKILLIYEKYLADVSLKIKKELENSLSLKVIKIDENDQYPSFEEYHTVILLKKDPFKNSAFIQKFKEIQFEATGKLVLAAIESGADKEADYKEKLDLEGKGNQPQIIVQTNLKLTRVDDPIINDGNLKILIQKIAATIPKL
jgi:hypothetical protein